MAKFIELHFNGSPVLVNLDKIDLVAEVNGHCGIYIDGDTNIVEQTYDQVRTMIANATGGIPMEGK